MALILPADSGAKIPILFGAVVALVGASLYQFYEVRQVRAELETTREALLDQISKVHETSTVSSKTNRQSVDSLKAQMDEARRQASILAGQAKLDATKHADDLAAKLEQAQQEQAARWPKPPRPSRPFQANFPRFGKTPTPPRAAWAKSRPIWPTSRPTPPPRAAELEKTIADLKSTRGDLGVQSGLIATNGKELAALRSPGRAQLHRIPADQGEDAAQGWRCPDPPEVGRREEEPLHHRGDRRRQAGGEEGQDRQ